MIRRPATIGLAALAATALAWGNVHAGGFAITSHAIVPGGGSSVSAGGCRQLSATFGEPVAGRASGGSFVIVAGYQAATPPGARDAIFHDGFQECQ